MLSLVNARIGNGPFSIVLEEGAFPVGAQADAAMLIFENGFWLDEWLIDAEEAESWDPRPNWETMRQRPEKHASAAGQISKLLEEHAPPDSLARLVIDPTAISPLPARIFQAAEQNIPLLYAGIFANDGALISEAAKKLAGLGPGLTPAGDDLLLGAMHGLWATLPPNEAEVIARRIANAAIPRTHALSAAWLAAAERGEAAEPWHQLLAAISEGDIAALNQAAMRILPTGHTSGADALSGFLGVLQGNQP